MCLCGIVRCAAHKMVSHIEMYLKSLHMILACYTYRFGTTTNYIYAPHIPIYVRLHTNPYADAYTHNVILFYFIIYSMPSGECRLNGEMHTLRTVQYHMLGTPLLYRTDPSYYVIYTHIDMWDIFCGVTSCVCAKNKCTLAYTHIARF